MKRNSITLSISLVILSSFTISGCGKASLSEAQSEVAGYCLFLLSKGKSQESIKLFSLIQRHVDERGFNKAGVKTGSLRALRELKGKDNTVLSDRQINECREVLNGSRSAMSY